MCAVAAEPGGWGAFPLPLALPVDLKGEMQVNASSATIESYNPATGELIKEYEPIPFVEADQILGKVSDAQGIWEKWPLDRRQTCFANLASLLDATRSANAALITRETGKPISQANAEIDKAIELCRYLADLDPVVLQEREVLVEEGAVAARIRQVPVGVLLVIMPANYPFGQPLRAAFPALLAGNAIALKHAASVPDCALTLEALLQQAGFPEHVFRTFLLSGKDAPVLITHQKVGGIAFTGRSELGSQVASLAAVQLKPCCLMLSGNDPCLILDDANVALAARLCAESRMQNAGQACIAAQRMIVLAEVADAFKQAFVREMETYRIGDPQRPETRLGPLTSSKLRDQIHAQVEESLEGGGKLLCGGKPPDQPGAFYPATVIDRAAPGMPVWDDEVFGPVAGITTVKSVEAAINAANDSPMALGASVFSADHALAAQIARDALNSSMCAVNRICRSYPAVPFGGRRASGLGHELGSEGLLHFTRVQTVLKER